jgi:hypothetical protein
VTNKEADLTPRQRPPAKGDLEVPEIKVERATSEQVLQATIETGEHRQLIQQMTRFLGTHLMDRGYTHDNSKLTSPEIEVFALYTPKLKTTTYGSEEYKRYLCEMKPALDHHYAQNAHHPECHPDGIRGMNLLDLNEMLCDWMAATKRHTDGDIRRSIELNQKRFGYSDDVKAILLNTVALFEEAGVPHV